MKKKTLIILIIIISVIVLWFSGIIPKQIGEIYATNYMKNNFPKMELEYISIEWNKYFGDYIITFKDNEEQSYGCVIGPKYFPISLRQGIFAIEEKYKESSSLNNNTTESYIPEGMEVADSNDIGILTDSIELNHDIENVAIEVIKDTITNKSLEILITDNNEDYYGWGVEFKIQKKLNGEWKDLNYISDDIAWIAIAYLPNENNQIKQKLNIEKYYGELEKGTYRVVKKVYDKGYIDIYSNEFEIK